MLDIVLKIRYIGPPKNTIFFVSNCVSFMKNGALELICFRQNPVGRLFTVLFMYSSARKT